MNTDNIKTYIYSIMKNIKNIKVGDVKKKGATYILQLLLNNTETPTPI
jgi:hypothetical protein